MSTTSPVLVRVRQVRSGSNKFYEGTVEIAGLQPTRIVNRRGEFRFANLSALKNSVNSLSRRWGFNIKYVDSSTNGNNRSQTRKKAVQSATT